MQSVRFQADMNQNGPLTEPHMRCDYIKNRTKQQTKVQQEKVLMFGVRDSLLEVDSIPRKDCFAL